MFQLGDKGSISQHFLAEHLIPAPSIPVPQGPLRQPDAFVLSGGFLSWISIALTSSTILRLPLATYPTGVFKENLSQRNLFDAADHPSPSGRL